MSVRFWISLGCLLVGCTMSPVARQVMRTDTGVGDATLDIRPMLEVEVADLGVGDSIAAGPMICGNGLREIGEQCDDRNTSSGDGCSGDCTQIEPDYACVPGQACQRITVCGDGRVTGSEVCDDRNTMAGDGCDAACRPERGWTCPVAGVACRTVCGDGVRNGTEQCDDNNLQTGDGCDALCGLEEGFVCNDSASCRRTTCGDGAVEGREECDDRNVAVGDGCDPFCKREPRCSNGTCIAFCGDGVRLPAESCDDGNAFSGDGCSSTCTVEPGFTCSDMLAAEAAQVVVPVTYRDFRGFGLPGGHEDFENVIADGQGLVTSMLGSDGKPIYASATTTASTHGRAAFDQWYRDVPGVNLSIGDQLALNRTGTATYVFDSNNFFPIDARGWVAAGSEPLRLGHNFSFTSETRYWFRYSGDEQLTFRGDDDVWVFINGHLAVDLGGVHSAIMGSVTLDAANATRFGLVRDGIYEAVVFQAERHTSQSSYRLTLVGFNLPRSACDDVCGDGIVTRYERCDDGINDGRYGGCAPGCLMLGPTCGDGVTQAANGEECDNGQNNGATCTPTCRVVASCGNHVVDAVNGEQCDDGNRNPGDGCDGQCRREIT